jgi:hypothetical protein
VARIEERMTVLHLTGRVTDSHELEVDLPPDVPIGQVLVTVEIPIAEPADHQADPTRIEPMTGAEIIAAGLTGVWADQAIQDGQQWLDASRQRRRAARQR